MSIRNATYHDAPIIKSLLTALGYTTRTSILISQLENCFGNGDHQVFVYEIRKEVIGFIAVHYLPQLTVEAGMLFITYISIDEPLNNPGVANALEQYVIDIARKRNCDKIIADCAGDPQFYLHYGFHENSNFFIKRLIDCQ